MDFEIPATNGSNGTSSERTTRSPAGGTDAGQSPAPNTKKPAATTNGTTTSTTASRDPSIPGTLTFSANPNANVGATTQGKKRKAGGAHAAASATAATSAAPTAPASRRKETTIAANMIRETNMMTFEKSGSRLKRGKLEADDGTLLAVDDHEDPNSPVDSLRVNWFYRPRDVLRYNNDTRLVYGTMHSDICPLTSLRGKCYIRHRSEIADFDEFRKTKDSFWFNQVFDRFIHRWYEVIPVSQVINVPEKVKKALDERWKFVVVETSRVKELTSAVKTCKRCSGYCAANDSVECAVCHNTYHMNCVRPPLLKKPSRGFAWACGPCGRAQERKLEARRTPIIGETTTSQEDEEVVDEEEEDPGAINTTAPSPSGDAKIDDHPATQAEIALAKMWPMRYLGIHCRVEDALQYDDRAIYPRASSRLGPRHQANVNVWHGRPVELVKPAEIRKRYNKGPAHKKDPKLSKEDLEADRAEKAKRPKWVQDEPAGYVRRGEDFPNDDPRCTAKAIFKMPAESVRGEDDAPADREKLIDDYMSRARSEVAKIVGVQEYNTNFLTKAIELLYANNYDADAALEQLKKINRRKDLREPEPNKEEKKRFEEGVAKYGSELRNVRLHVRTMSHADVVRYYYLWKKTPKGKEIWGNYDGRKGKNQKVAADSTSKLVDDIADDVDDSAFDFGKADARKKSFVCKFCSTKKSRQWRRAPGVAPGQTVPADGRSKDKGTNLIPGLCQRCARLWRKYAIKYEDADELIKKISAAGGKKWKKLIDQELMDEINAAQNAPPEPVPSIEPVDPLVQTTTEPSRKKQKGTSEKDTSQQASAEPPTKKKMAAVPPKPPTPPPQPVMPKMRELPCAICLELEPLGEQRLVCRECRLTVHRQCYGVTESRSGKWVCDQCKNDKKETVSYELIEPPKVSHKKKTDKEREKERLEKELRIQKLKEYQQHQRDKGRPELPREPLKKTAENNWVHLHCAVWTPELKFTNPKTYELVEGVGTPTIKYDQVCKICKTAKGACVSCHQCHTSFHVGCAHSAGYTFGFDVTPVKSSRRDAVLTFTLGQETGSLSAAIWCKEHTPKTIIHPLNEVVDESGKTALQLYVQNYKQADQTLTGTARKANLLDQFTKNIPPPVVAAQPVNRRTSTVQAGARSARNSSAGLPKMEEPDEIQTVSLSDYKEERKCEICDVEVSPKWWKVEDSQDAGSNPDQPVNTIEGAVSSIQPPVGTPASQSEGPRFPNGIIHPEQPGVPREALGGKATTPDGIPLPRPGSYLCNKCHWRRKNKPELLKPPKKSPTPPPQPRRLRRFTTGRRLQGLHMQVRPFLGGAVIRHRRQSATGWHIRRSLVLLLLLQSITPIILR
ncbi:putative PHD type zinc finger protein with BAH domain-containing protein [Neofusicoccum ribis]|uniref:PHD type zinc finger protein with BAH domain-containing protein n=1 Tax=Neofusicoccum ribis TaxID=45134 RepID=A0ABR3TCR9_9PEZI